jgi:voltage-gated potassium channel
VRQHRPAAAPRDHRDRLTPEERRLRVAVVVFFTVVAVGVVGYKVIEHVPWLDALYMTVITITTVGFGEIVELSNTGRAFTLVLIASGVSTVSYGALTAAEFVVEGHLRHVIERRRMLRDIADLSHHIIICGFGRVGVHVAEELIRDDDPFVVVDNDEGKLERLGQLGYLHVEGDATEEHVLSEAGLERARALVAAVNSDADNVLITLTAKGISPSTIVIARAKADENEAKLRRAGADKVIAPTTIGGRRIAQILTRPAVAEFLEGEGSGGVDYTLEEVPVHAGGEFDGSTLAEAAIRDRFGVTVLAVVRADGALDSHPAATSRLHAGDTLVVIGSDDEVTHLRARFKRRR